MQEVSIVGFRGIGFKVRPAERLHPLLRAGHVGVSLDKGKTVIGFSPALGAVRSVENIIDDLKNSAAVFVGQLYDDTTIFQQAHQLFLQGERTDVWQLPVNVSESHFRAIEATLQIWLHDGLPYPTWYSFPLLTPERENVPMPPQCDNCATWPRKLGLSIPELTGQLSLYVTILKSLGRPWPERSSR